MSEPPFLRIELAGYSAVGPDKITMTRETYESTQVKIESPARVIYCPVADVCAALATMIQPEVERLEGN